MCRRRIYPTSWRAFPWHWGRRFWLTYLALFVATFTIIWRTFFQMSRVASKFWSLPIFWSGCLIRFERNWRPKMTRERVLAASIGATKTNKIDKTSLREQTSQRAKHTWRILVLEPCRKIEGIWEIFFCKYFKFTKKSVQFSLQIWSCFIEEVIF